MIYLLYIALGYLLFTSFIFGWNRRTFGGLRTVANYVTPSKTEKISICIPARNEERNIKKCVESALQQNYDNLEVLVLDDNSDDQTPEILNTLKKKYPGKLAVFKGQPKPGNWLGKPWACHQLSQEADGKILIFIDADVWLHTKTVSRLVRTMGSDVIDFATVWPQQILGTFWEKVLIPLIYYALATLLPVAYVRKNPRWLPKTIRKKVGPLFAAACGQFMAFKRPAYDKIGGHKAVKSDIVEDVALAKAVKKQGLSMDMYHGVGSVFCRMYTSHQEIRDGFRKNFLAGFNFNIPLFVFMSILQAVVFLLPLVTLFYGFFATSISHILISAISIIIVWTHRAILAKWFKWQPSYGLLHALGVIWFQWLGVDVLRDYFGDRSAKWKGRSIIVDS